MVLVATMAACSTGAGDNKPQFSSFKSLEGGYSIEYPGDWGAKKDAIRGVDSFEPIGSRDSLSFEVDYHNAALNVPADLTAEQIAEHQVQAIQENWDTQADVVGYDSSGGYKVVLLEFTIENTGDLYDLSQAVIVRNRRMWFLTLTMQPGEREYHQDTFEHFIESFREIEE